MSEKTGTSDSAAADLIWCGLDLLRDTGVMLEEGFKVLLALLVIKVNSNRYTEDNGFGSVWEKIRKSDHPSGAIEGPLHDLELDELFTDGSRLLNNKVFRELVSLIDQIEVDSFLAQEADSLWTTLLGAAPTYLGTDRTPNSIMRLMVALLDPQPDCSLIDPTCGTGSFLTASSLHIRKDVSAKFAHVRGVEIMPAVAALAKANLVLNGLMPNVVCVGDVFALANSKNWSGQFDYVISNPPAGSAHGNDYLRGLEDSQLFKFGPPLRANEFNFIQLAVSLLKPGGMGLLLIRLRPLFASGKEGELRRRLIQAGCIKAVITLAASLLPTTVAQCAILVVTNPKDGKRDDGIKFIAADDEFIVDTGGKRILTASNIDTILKTVRTNSEIEGVSRIANQELLADHDFKLLPSLYFPDDVTGLCLGQDVVWNKIQDVADVLRGPSLGNLPTGEMPILQGRNLSSRVIYTEDLEKKDVSGRRDKLICAELGDILIQRIGDNPAAYCVDQDLSGLPTSDTVYVIRLRERDIEKSRFITQFLNSEVGQSRLRAKTSGAVVPTLSKTVVKSYEIPFADHAIIKLALELDGIEGTLHDQIDTAQELKARLFGVDEAQQFITKFQEIRLNSQILKELLQNTDKLEYQIRNHFPYLLAFPYRSLASLVDVAIHYKEQLRFAENILAYLASTGLSLLQLVNKERIMSSQLSSEIQTSWQNGISPGHWKNLWQRSCYLLRENHRYPFAATFGSACFAGRGSKQSRLAELFSKFVEAINNDKHQRGPGNVHEYEKESNQLAEALIECLELLKFLVQSPVVKVVELDTKWGMDKVNHKIVVYKGDHPALPTDEILCDRPQVRNHLYIRLSNEDLVSLYPMFSLHYNERSKRQETYLLDKCDPNGSTVVLRSIESHHTFKNTSEAFAVGADFTTWRNCIF